MPHYDYMQFVDLRVPANGDMAYGFGQLVRTEIKFTYVVSGQTIKMTYGLGSSSAPRSLKFKLGEGNFLVRDHDYGGVWERRYRCRLTFSDNPFPPDAESDVFEHYYADLVSEKKPRSR